MGNGVLGIGKHREPTQISGLFGGGFFRRRYWLGGRRKGVGGLVGILLMRFCRLGHKFQLGVDEHPSRLPNIIATATRRRSTMTGWAKQQRGFGGGLANQLGRSHFIIIGCTV